ncbi:hypothetical protein [uncultured Sphingomonas sp.]|uniref:hypothetical protein n=1 Tax=uncultured Sphingomonas sp. TaxID=158754 RepID=UPI0035C9706A
MDAARNSHDNNDEGVSVPASDAAHNYLVSCRLDDSWSTLEQGVALIDRLFGGEITALFERHGDDGRRHVRG